MFSQFETVPNLCSNTEKRDIEDIPLTVVVPVKNEADNIFRCLNCLSRFSEVVIVDSGSSDATVAIAEAWGAVVVQFEWNGGYPKKRNWILENFPFKTEWVLFLDADEIISDEFCSEVARAIRSNTYVGYWLAYRKFFLGRELRYGVKQRKLALFRTQFGRYERIENEDKWTSLDMEIHEHPILAGSAGSLRSPIEHNDYRGLLKFLDRHREYARWESARFLALQGCRPIRGHTARQRYKYKNISKWWYPWLYFVYDYVVSLGFLDGVAGFLYALYKAWYFLTVGLLIREQMKKRSH